MEKDEKVIEQGSVEADYFYIVKSGMFEVDEGVHISRRADLEVLYAIYTSCIQCDSIRIISYMCVYQLWSNCTICD